MVGVIVALKLVGIAVATTDRERVGGIIVCRSQTEPVVSCISVSWWCETVSKAVSGCEGVANHIALKHIAAVVGITVEVVVAIGTGIEIVSSAAEIDRRLEEI